MVLYPTRYEAKKRAFTHEKIIKVEGGYTIMTEEEYRKWKNQK